MAIPLTANPHQKIKRYGNNVAALRRPPYPIPLSDWQGDAELKTFYTGHLTPAGVEMRDKKEMEAIFSRGFFGKGNLSKSAPTYNHELLEGKLRKMSRQRYERHCKIQNSTTVKKPVEKEKVIVVDEPDTEMNEESTDTEHNDEKIMIETVLEDPCPATETLLLMFEEAFFLSYALGCLLIVQDTGNYLSLKEMWKKFYKLPNGHQFPINYAAYHHFRSKGWVVRNGLKFGTKYILYKDGPPFNHASYSVIVQPVWKNTLRNCSQTGDLSWHQILAINRVNINAGKEVIICYVICPETVTAADMESPNIIKTLQVQEVLVRRWVAAKERNDDQTSTTSDHHT